MKRTLPFLQKNFKEIGYQALAIGILFIFYSYHQEDAEVFSLLTLITPYKFAFFGNYLGAAIIIGYLLSPKLFHKNNYTLFLISCAALVALVILVDEFILEQIFFPDTRGAYFPGVLFSLVETIPIILMLVSFKFFWDFHIKQNEIEQLKVHVKESELQFLKSQINPHFLFNNLNNLYSYSLENSPKTSSIIIELSSVLRYMLYDCREDFVLVSKELSHLRNFTKLNKLQIEDRGEVTYHEDISSSKFKIAPLILVVFIENAFKHSTKNQSENISIDIKTSISKEGVLNFECINNFEKGYKESTLVGGIGLENVKKRLNLLYPHNHMLSLETDKNLFKTKLSLQLKTLD